MKFMLLTFAMLTFLTGCGAGPETSAAPSNSTPPTPPRETSFTFVLSGDTAGFIVPCGCTTKQFGGLPRRATYLNEMRANFGPWLIYLDAGGNVQHGTPYDEVKLEYILKGVNKMGILAVNLGAGEMSVSPATLQAQAAIAPLLSVHVSPPKTADAFRRSRGTIIVGEGHPNVGVAVLGVNLTAKADGAFFVADPRAELQKEISKLAKQYDAIVLLAYGDEQSALKLAGDFPELTALFIAGCGQSVAPRTENGLVIAGVAQKGKFLARVTLTGRRNNWKLSSGEIVELSESFADDPAQIENLNAYKTKLKELKLDPKDTGEVSALLNNLPAGYRYAGSAACAKCHVQDGALHAKSPHAHGLETLRAKDFAFDPYCLKCHTTGYGGPGGFVNAEATPQLGGIGCENCHGPSQAHVLNPRVKTPVTDSKNACLSCHDPENSPKFEYQAYWQKIAHGQEKVK